MQVETSTVILGGFALITSAITVAGAVVGPILQSRSRTREKQQEFELARVQKAEDYARQDKVAADLLRRQDEIAAKVERTAQLAAENARIAAESAVKLEGKVDGVHLLVNSNLTNEKKKTLAVMLEIADLKTTMGKKPTPEFLAEVEALKQELVERKRQDDIVQKEQELSKLKLETIKTEGDRRAAAPVPSQQASALSRDNAQRLDKLEAAPTPAPPTLTPRPPPPPIPVPSVAITIEPVKVADDRVAVATERMAEAAEKTASAATETASAATKTAEAATDKKT